MIKKIYYFIIILFLSISFKSIAQHGNMAYNTYIDTYSKIAVKQQKEHGIPASITLAQGLLESGAGRSELAIKGNNHFGIKCHDWDGKKLYYDDDEKNECFRKYKHAQESFEDHSAFLKNRSRYSSLFLLETTDYKNWAHGLKKAGYATDPSYAYKLIAIIEEYELHRFDLTSTKALAKEEKAKNKRTKKAKKEKQPKTKDVIAEKEKIGSVYAFSEHEALWINGIRYVYAKDGDTYGSIANEFGLKEEKILEYNEMPADAKPAKGERVYLERKKRKAEKGFDNYVIQEGDSMYSIAQYFGIRLIDLYDMNKMPYTEYAEIGKIIKLRP